LDLEVAFQYAGLLAVRASLLAHVLLCIAACHEKIQSQLVKSPGLRIFLEVKIAFIIAQKEIM